MPKRVLDLPKYLEPDALASQLGLAYDKWVTARRKKEAQWAELRNYLFATDTTTTTNAALPWKNSTTRPKLTQIRDNLHANYMAALFPNDDWFDWIAADRDAATKDKADTIKTYMKNKLNLGKFKQEISKLVQDYIDYGNCFADVEYVNETHTMTDGTVNTIYAGPILRRVSPYDIVFDITSNSFRESPKITRTLVSLGDLAKMANTHPLDNDKWQKAFTKAKDIRGCFGMYQPGDIRKSEGFVADGFGSIHDYYGSGYVEILHFEGDWYDTQADKLYENHSIIVVDRTSIVYNGKIENWFGRSLKEHVGWRLRPDNLWAMGPLDNLVGIQYRIDHLENLKADVFDQIAYPFLKVKGYVEDFEWGPGQRAFCGEEGDIETLVPDSTALNADFQISVLEQSMEDMAGAPKQAMGIRTPGEKTAYEVQTLENAAGRIFQNKVTYFEENFVEPVLNNMLEIARRNMDAPDLVRSLDPDIGVQQFMLITREDLTAKGKLVPRGARHFASKAMLVQNLSNMAGSAIYQDQGVRIHLSGKQMAKALVEGLGLEPYGIYRENVMVEEQQQTTRLINAAEDTVMEEAMTPDTAIPETQDIEMDQTESPD